MSSIERLQQVGHILPLLPPHPLPQHNERPLTVNGVVTFPFHLKRSFLVPVFLCDFFRLYQTPG